MRLTMQQRQAVVAKAASRYQRSSKREKGLILSELVELTDYSRVYARRVLRQHGHRIKQGKQSLLADVRVHSARSRAPYYDEQVKTALVKIWRVMDYICGKRLQPALAELVTVLERHNELHCTRLTREKLLQISAATIDRLLRAERRKYELRGQARTKPGTLMKHQIPIRTFAEWDEQQPGFGEIDLVGHDGGVAAGDYCQTLDFTDVATTWTETIAVRNKAQSHVFAAIQKVRKNLPFALLGLDSDNGSEFINDQLLRYCRQEKITFTRSRPYRKNDNCFVEQKNYSIVRRAVGYTRYDTAEQWELLNELYSYLRLYTNFFLPTMKLKSKERVGSKVKKCYDQALTPYQRVLQSPMVGKAAKDRLRARYATLNPAALKRKLERLQQRLAKTSNKTNWRECARMVAVTAAQRTNPF
jgi:integrase-like protein